MIALRVKAAAAAISSDSNTGKHHFSSETIVVSSNPIVKLTSKLVSRVFRRAPGDDCPFPNDLKEKYYKNTNEDIVAANGGNPYFALTRPVKDSYNMLTVWDLEAALKVCDENQEVPRQEDWPIYVPFCYNYSKTTDPSKRYQNLIYEQKIDKDSSGDMYACLLYYIQVGPRLFYIDLMYQRDIKLFANRAAKEEEERAKGMVAFDKANTDQEKAKLGLGMTISSVNANFGSKLAPKNLCPVPNELDKYVQLPSTTFEIPRELYEKIFIDLLGCIQKLGTDGVDNMKWPRNTGFCATEAITSKPDAKIPIQMEHYLVCIRSNMKKAKGEDFFTGDPEDSPPRSRSSAMYLAGTKPKSKSLAKAPEGKVVVKDDKNGEPFVVEKGNLIYTGGGRRAAKKILYDQEWLDVDELIKNGLLKNYAKNVS